MQKLVTKIVYDDIKNEISDNFWNKEIDQYFWFNLIDYFWLDVPEMMLRNTLKSIIKKYIENLELEDIMKLYYD